MHAKGHVRGAFEEVAEYGQLWSEDLSLNTPIVADESAFDGQPFGALLGKLHNCTDGMPASPREEVRDAFDNVEDEPFTYA